MDKCLPRASAESRTVSITQKQPGFRKLIIHWLERTCLRLQKLLKNEVKQCVQEGSRHRAVRGQEKGTRDGLGLGVMEIYFKAEESSNVPSMATSSSASQEVTSGRWCPPCGREGHPRTVHLKA